MTFRLDLANRASLFSNYASWHEDGNISDKAHVNFAFNICHLINSLESLHKHQEETLQQFKIFGDKLNSEKKNIYFQSPSLFNVFSEISTSLIQLRIIQNTFLDIISKKIKTSLPSSMSKYIKRIKHNSELEEKIYQKISEYWRLNGAIIKDFRDVDQHFGHLFTHAIIIRKNKNLNIELILPDNPKDKNLNKFTYEKQIDAIKFVQDSFWKLHDLVNDISQLVGYKDNRVFDLNLFIENTQKNYLTIAFDPFQNILVGQEVYTKDNKLYCMIHKEEYDLNKFSFVKIPKYFDGQKMQVKNYVVNQELKLDHELTNVSTTDAVTARDS